MKLNFLKELRESGYLHRPLCLHTEKSYEASLLDKKVLSRKVIWKDSGLGAIKASGSASVQITPHAGVTGGNALTMRCPIHADHFPEGFDPPARYINYSIAKIHLPIPEQSFEDYNRLSLWVKADFVDNQTVHFVIGMQNSGKKPLPDKYFREGYHVANIQTGVYNHIVWEMAELPRDRITELTLYAFMKGYNGASAEECVYHFDDIAMEQIATPDHVVGWKPPYPTVIYSTAGYDTKGQKTALITSDAPTFTLYEQGGKPRLTKQVSFVENDKGRFGILDFSEITQQGSYYL